ncbi:MAG: hypothetical protein B7X59_01825 [Polaromonas sp. 39-63-203]|jgi:hypothetical protein|uniref:DUF4276 family protein n=1 Tax=Polaromonas sp. TaxID=1869339 RepID=UPI000BD9B8C3|nr:DUF4276 family protein [Polaromonas sp.]OYY53775.1 MAG: hypothetical protein B7Y54_01635 [Polaromonas sp. 35-63-240]OYZ02402.1 MAG: hypothetical protein B7Y42_02645 [Polaromonas sp. 28-63-22]OYZ84791.1 MAG: hypothetical protein B7Y03_01930 [Polaromonas sp. 24-62-144]OZB01107.1 MAG: hypothetical protein B7X59_01825 [Polaromonas sp. 39-63-203]HQS30774.1 DUF4276 family protein [Polaromonas sp.]
MIWIEVLVEGASDLPTVKEVLERKFKLVEGEHFRMHAHKGKGQLPGNPLKRPDPKHQGLLDQLPAKLRGYGKSLEPHSAVLVVIDTDTQDCKELLAQLNSMLLALPVKPRVMFRLAIEETESWFIADINALRRAYPGGVKTSGLKHVQPDAVVGAWEKLAEALGVDRKMIAGPTKFQWAQKIAPHLDLEQPKSPSFKKLIDGIASLIQN